MKKKIFGGIAVLAIATVVAFNVNLFLEKQDSLSIVSLNNLEALGGGFGEWWNRPDYNCVDVTCITVWGGEWKSTVAEYAGNGNGSVAHSWNCIGCGDNGWKV